MQEDLFVLIKELEKIISCDEFVSKSYEIIEKLKELNNSFDAVEPILKLMEENKNVDFGNPGPLTHFIETFYKKGYEEKLVESIKRCPTEHTLWLLNRIINGANDEKKECYLKLLESVANSIDFDNNIILTAREFLEYQD